MINQNLHQVLRILDADTWISVTPLTPLTLVFNRLERLRQFLCHMTLLVYLRIHCPAQPRLGTNRLQTKDRTYSLCGLFPIAACHGRDSSLCRVIVVQEAAFPCKATLAGRVLSRNEHQHIIVNDEEHLMSFGPMKDVQSL